MSNKTSRSRSWLWRAWLSVNTKISRKRRIKWSSAGPAGKTSWATTGTWCLLLGRFATRWLRIKIRRRRCSLSTTTWISFSSLGQSLKSIRWNRPKTIWGRTKRLASWETLWALTALKRTAEMTRACWSCLLTRTSTVPHALALKRAMNKSLCKMWLRSKQVRFRWILRRITWKN